MNTTAEAISSNAAEPVDLALAVKGRDLAHLRQQHRQDAMPSGTLIQKIIDQCRCSANTPPMIGPPMPATVHTPEK